MARRGREEAGAVVALPEDAVRALEDGDPGPAGRGRVDRETITIDDAFIQSSSRPIISTTIGVIAETSSPRPRAGRAPLGSLGGRDGLATVKTRSPSC